MTFTELLTYIVGGGGAGALASGLVTWLRGGWPWLNGLRPDVLRIVVIAGTGALTAAIGALAILLQAWYGDAALPATAQDWVGRLWLIASTAGLGGQIAHKIATERACAHAG